MNATEKLLQDFVLFLYEKKKLALCKEVEGELGWEWVPMVLRPQDVAADFLAFQSQQKALALP